MRYQRKITELTQEELSFIRDFKEFLQQHNASFYVEENCDLSGGKNDISMVSDQFIAERGGCPIILDMYDIEHLINEI